MALTDAIEHAFAPARDLVDTGRLPGAVLGAVTVDGARAVNVHGSAQLEPEPVPLGRETVFDLASLTKALFTTPTLLGLVANGRLDLDAPLGELIPDLRQHDLNAPERRLTTRRCLTHRTHLPAVEPLYTLGLEPRTLEAYVLQRAWPVGPSVYSDINFILLGILVTRLSGMALDEHPLLHGLTFRPDPGQCAATERCPWRRRVLRGEVHDENAFAFGGAAGHAGLFGTVDAVLDFARDVLRAAPDVEDPLHPLLQRETDDRTLGWQMSAPGWSGGDTSSPRAIGHVGFTGTGVWIDFDRGLAWTLLTNRVHPTRHAPSVMLSLRPQVSDRLLNALAA